MRRKYNHKTNLCENPITEISYYNTQSVFWFSIIKQSVNSLYKCHFLTPLFEPYSPHIKLKMDHLIKLSGVEGY